jgi:putative flippase GtrA
MNKHGLYQIMRFGIVGVAAAIVHFSMVVLLVQEFAYAPLLANVAGFLIAVQVSYFGHRHWTFSETSVLHREAYPKLIAVQVMNFSLNEMFYYVLLSLHLPYQLALLLVIAIMPIFTYLSSRWWVFQV